MPATRARDDADDDLPCMDNGVFVLDDLLEPISGDYDVVRLDGLTFVLT